MPVKTKAINAIDINTVSDNIDKCVNDFFAQYNLDIYNIADIKSVSHNMLNLCFKYIYKSLFKPSTTLVNNQKSLVDYDNLDLMALLADKFIEICQHFNKSLGLMSFGFMLGCNYKTIYNWLNDGGSNPQRLQILKNIQECHKVAQINLLNDSQVGALAVANNDVETGLEWAKQTAALQASNTVYILPSERVDRMRLQAPED